MKQYIPLDGINEKGVACGIYMSYQGPERNVAATVQQTEKPDITSSTMFRMIIDIGSMAGKLNLYKEALKWVNIFKKRIIIEVFKVFVGGKLYFAPNIITFKGYVSVGM